MFHQEISNYITGSLNYKLLPFEYVITFKIQPNKNVRFYDIC